MTEAFSTTCAVHIEDCGGWWLSGCCGSVAEHWRLKPEVSWVRLPATAGFFTFLYFHLITSKLIRHEARCSEQWYFGKQADNVKANYQVPFICWFLLSYLQTQPRKILSCQWVVLSPLTGKFCRWVSWLMPQWGGGESHLCGLWVDHKSVGVLRTGWWGGA